MNINYEEKARELAEQHWDWLEGILLQQLQVQRRLFIDAMVHGYGHREKEIRETTERLK